MKWLSDKRIEKKLTQNQIAKACNISPSFYCQIENDKRNPSIITAKKIAYLLEFDWYQFFEKKEEA